MSKRYDYPDKSGNINIYPEIVDGNVVTISIIGDPRGLKYLAELLNYLADFDQEESQSQVGCREHIHLHANEQLDAHSCEVEICRADAKGTGELPEFMRAD